MGPVFCGLGPLAGPWLAPGLSLGPGGGTGTGSYPASPEMEERLASLSGTCGGGTVEMMMMMMAFGGLKKQRRDSVDSGPAVQKHKGGT